MFKVEYAWPRGSQGAKSCGTRVRKTLPFEDKLEAEKHAKWLNVMGCKKVRVIEESK